MTLLNPYPTVASVYPANVAVGAFTLTMNGSGFVPGAQVAVRRRAAGHNICIRYPADGERDGDRRQSGKSGSGDGDESRTRARQHPSTP